MYIRSINSAENFICSNCASTPYRLYCTVLCSCCTGSSLPYTWHFVLCPSCDVFVTCNIQSKNRPIWRQNWAHTAGCTLYKFRPVTSRGRITICQQSVLSASRWGSAPREKLSSGEPDNEWMFKCTCPDFFPCGEELLGSRLILSNMENL